MEFAVGPEIWERFPGMRLAVVVARGVDNRAPNPAVDERWRRAWRDAADHAVHGNAQSHPRVAPWRDRLRAAGAHPRDFPSSIEAMLRRSLKGGEPFRINPLVDLYNAVSLTHVVPAGGFDLATVRGPLELRLAREGDRFLALDAEAPEEVAPGEVAYMDGSVVLTRHFVWKQARDALITEATTDVFLVSEILGEMGGEVAEAVRDDLRSGLERHFGVEPESWIVDENEPQVEW